MNSKIIFFILILLSLAGCGVKAPPMKYPETIVDSYTKEYTGVEPTPEEIERTREKPAIQSTLDPQRVLDEKEQNQKPATP